MALIVFASYQAALLLSDRESGRTQTTVSLDLGQTTTPVLLTADGVTLPDGQTLSWEAVAEIADGEWRCFTIENNTAIPVRAFSEETGRVFALYATESGWPTMLVSGIPMHRIKNTEPHADTLAKVRALGAVHGRVLDTATGLGYTAIELAKTPSSVVTIEIDPAAQEICRLNPWSQPLFDNPRITQKIGDSFTVVDEFADEHFAAILHDPPTLSLGGDLYSGQFYQKLFRVLRRGGRLFHYIGDPESRTGAGATRGVIKRLHNAGFSKVSAVPDAFGVVATK